MIAKFVVRHSHGRSWAVDKLIYFGPKSKYYSKANTRYFPTPEEAEAFKKRSEEQERRYKKMREAGAS